jgi:hypothetical protein
MSLSDTFFVGPTVDHTEMPSERSTPSLGDATADDRHSFIFNVPERGVQETMTRLKEGLRQAKIDADVALKVNDTKFQITFAAGTKVEYHEYENMATREEDGGIFAAQVPDWFTGQENSFAMISKNSAVGTQHVTVYPNTVAEYSLAKGRIRFMDEDCLDGYRVKLSQQGDVLNEGGLGSTVVSLAPPNSHVPKIQSHQRSWLSCASQRVKPIMRVGRTEDSNHNDGKKESWEEDSG